MHNHDSLAEWSKAPDLGSGPKGRGFKSHSCQFRFFFPFLWASLMLFWAVSLVFNWAWIWIFNLCFWGDNISNRPNESKNDRNTKIGETNLVNKIIVKAITIKSIPFSLKICFELYMIEKRSSNSIVS